MNQCNECPELRSIIKIINEQNGEILSQEYDIQILQKEVCGMAIENQRLEERIKSLSAESPGPYCLECNAHCLVGKEGYYCQNCD